MKLRCDSFIQSKSPITGVIVVANKNAYHLYNLHKNPNYRYYGIFNIKYLIDFSLDHPVKKPIIDHWDDGKLQIITNAEAFKAIVNDIDIVFISTCGMYTEYYYEPIVAEKYREAGIFELDWTTLTVDDIYNNVSKEVEILEDLYAPVDPRPSRIWLYEYQRYVLEFFNQYFLSKGKKVYAFNDFYSHRRGNESIYIDELNFPENYYSNYGIYRNIEDDPSITPIEDFNYDTEFVFVMGTDWGVGKQTYCINRALNDENATVLLNHNFDILGFKSIPKTMLGREFVGIPNKEAIDEIKTYYINELSHEFSIIYYPLVGRAEFYINYFIQSQQDALPVWRSNKNLPGRKNKAFHDSQYKVREFPPAFHNPDIKKRFILVKKPGEDVTDIIETFKYFNLEFDEIVEK